MNRNRLNYLSSAWIVTALVFLLVLYGCSPQSKYKVLSFFFTGVPSPEEVERRKQEALEKEKRAKLAAEKLAAAPESTPAKPPEPRLHTHTPVSQRRCDGCHLVSVNVQLFRKGDKKGAFKKGGGSPGILVAPRKALCQRCHQSMSAVNANAAGFFLHTPAGNGECDQCHDPHQSEYPGILLEKAEDICFQCHSGKEMATIPGHADQETCLNCHNPHLGLNRFLLIKDFKEKKKKAVFFPDDSAPQGATGNTENALPPSH